MQSTVAWLVYDLPRRFRLWSDVRKPADERLRSIPQQSGRLPEAMLAKGPKVREDEVHGDVVLLVVSQNMCQGIRPPPGSHRHRVVELGTCRSPEPGVGRRRHLLFTQFGVRSAPSQG